MKTRSQSGFTLIELLVVIARVDSRKVLGRDRLSLCSTIGL